MKNVSSGMSSLCEDIVKSSEERTEGIKTLKKETGVIRNKARKFISDCQKRHNEMANDLRKGLLKHRENLIKNTSSLREGFREKQREIYSDLTEANKIWNKMQGVLKTRRK